MSDFSGRIDSGRVGSGEKGNRPTVFVLVAGHAYALWDQIQMHGDRPMPRPQEEQEPDPGEFLTDEEAESVKEGWVTIHPVFNKPVEVVNAAYVRKIEAENDDLHCEIQDLALARAKARRRRRKTRKEIKRLRGDLRYILNLCETYNPDEYDHTLHVDIVTVAEQALKKETVANV